MVNLSKFSGFGATGQKVRSALIDSLTAEGVTNAQVKQVMKSTPRHFFIDDALSRQAYRNITLPIGFSQTISQPLIVGLMTQAVVEGDCGNILEIGSGCGYQTAVLAQIFDKVYSVERIQGLYNKAKKKLAELGLNNIELSYGDGFDVKKYQDNFFDAIMLTAAPEYIPDKLLKKLKKGGRLVAPVGSDNGQKLVKMSFDGIKITKKEIADVIFVPLISGIE